MSRWFLEFSRDFTSFGNSFLLIAVYLLVKGFEGIYLQIAGLIIVEVVCSFIKLAFFRHRPKKQSFRNLLQKIEAASFPSLHCARSGFAFLFMQLGLWTLIFPIIVGITRIHLQKHRPIDVIAGFAIGALVFVLLRIV